ncbi:MAG UNVERIFIED_CONTAM: tetratricopeptide repeat protein [Planctomycetaceae bacterium]
MRRAGCRLLCAVPLTVALLSLTVSGCSSSDSQQLYHDGLKAARAADRQRLLECIQSLPDDDSVAPVRAVLRGHLHCLDNKPRLALLEFSLGNRDERTREESWFQAGKLSYEAKQYAEALALFRQVIQWNADRLEAHQLMAAACYDIGAMEQAIGSLKEVMRLQPDDFRPRHMEASILQDFERFGDAELAWREAAARVPPESTASEEVHAGWGIALFGSENMTQRWKCLRKPVRGPMYWPAKLRPASPCENSTQLARTLPPRLHSSRCSPMRPS